MTGARGDHLTLNGGCDNRHERVLDLYAQGMVHDEISAIGGLQSGRRRWTAHLGLSREAR